MSTNSTELAEKQFLRVDRLHDTREQRGLSQRELAKRCALSINQINRYETGATEPSANILALIARELGVSTDYLLGLSDIPTANAPDKLHPDERDLLEAYILGDSTTMLMLMYERLQKLGKSPQRHET